MTKKIIPIILIIISTLSIIFLYNRNKTNNPTKFYLNKEYYNKNNFIQTKEISNLKKKSYILFTYNNYCTLPIPCETIFEEFTKKNNIAIVSIPFENFRKTYLYKEVKYAPSIIVINKGKIVTYLDANSDNDLPKYQNVSEFENWISKYVYLTN